MPRGVQETCVCCSAFVASTGGAFLEAQPPPPEISRAMATELSRCQTACPMNTPVRTVFLGISYSLDKEGGGYVAFEPPPGVS